MRRTPRHYPAIRLASLVVLWLGVMGEALSAQSVTVDVAGDTLRVQAPRLRFVDGRPLDLLQDGGAVTFEIELGLLAGPNGPVRVTTRERFNLSYDLWEEWFAVTRIGSPSLSISRLSAREAEAWCLENLKLDVGDLDPREPFWVRIKYQAQSSEPEAEGDDIPLFSLEGLIDLLSRGDAGVMEGAIEAGPFRLSEFR